MEIDDRSISSDSEFPRTDTKETVAALARDQINAIATPEEEQAEIEAAKKRLPALEEEVKKLEDELHQIKNDSSFPSEAELASMIETTAKMERGIKMASTIKEWTEHFGSQTGAVQSFYVDLLELIMERFENNN